VGGLVGFSAAAGGSASFRFRPDLSCPIGDPAGPAGGGSALFFSDLDKKRRIGLKSIQVSFDELTTVRDFFEVASIDLVFCLRVHFWRKVWRADG
jgi:hypothetical protein